LKYKGIYILKLHLPKDKNIIIGKKGESFFGKGYYLYVGSAAGPGGIEGRLKHHKNRISKPHWHIDYLRLHAEVIDIFILQGEKELEHHIAKILESHFQPAMDKFGSSDCGCTAHLFYSVRGISLQEINKITSCAFTRDK